MQVDVVTLTREEISEIIEKTVKRAIAELHEDTKTVPELMTKSELAEYLRCDVSKINRYMGHGLPIEQFGKSPLFRKSDIDLWLKRERTKALQGKAA